jgi:hypothetical protein
MRVILLIVLILLVLIEVRMASCRPARPSRIASFALLVDTSGCVDGGGSGDFVGRGTHGRLRTHDQHDEKRDKG